MIQFIEKYAPHILTVIVILAPTLRTLAIRVVSDKNNLKQFENVKETVENFRFNEADITTAISKVDIVAKSLKNEIDKMNFKVNVEIERINETVLEFQNSEVVTKMLLGLSQLDELAQLIKNKDTTIEQLGQVIKDIKKKLGD